MEKSVIKLFKEDYCFNPSSPKWISVGGEILKYQGQKVLFVDFKKESEDSQWTTSQEVVDIIGISGYEEMTGTYLIAYKKGEETLSERITPEGFSFNIPDRDLWMHRFLPLSLHMEITETELIYKRYQELFNTKDSLGIQEIRKYCQGPQKDTVGYKNYISLITDTSVEEGLGVGICEFRIKQFSMPQDTGKNLIIGFRDQHNNFYMLRAKKDHETESMDLKVGDIYIGKAKIIDLQG